MKISREIKTGLAFIGAIALFVWGFSFLKGRGLFQNQDYYYAIYNQVGGLVQSSPISINGVKVGLVSDVYFEEKMTGLVVVRMRITTKFPIPSNSIARIYSSDLMGSRAVEIIPGNSLVYAKPGDTLAGSVEASLKEEVNQQVAPLKRKAEDMISSFDSVLMALQAVFNEESRANISGSFASIRVSLRNIEHTTSNIDTFVTAQKGRLGNILANVESVSNNLKANNQEISAVIRNIRVMTDTLSRLRVYHTMNNLDMSLAQVATILQKIEKGEGSAGKLLADDSLYNNLTKAGRELELLLEDIRRNPKRYVRVSVF